MRTTLLALAALALVGCGDERDYGISPTSSSAVRTYCDHGNRLYYFVGSYNGAIAVVPNDPSCTTVVPVPLPGVKP